MAHTVVLVEDDPRIRERLAALITANANLKLLAIAGNFVEGRTALKTQTPDVLLLDLGLPDGDGADLIPLALRANVRVIVMSVFNNGARLDAALKAGADGCLFKDSSPRAIGHAVAALFAESPIHGIPGDAPRGEMAAHRSRGRDV